MSLNTLLKFVCIGMLVTLAGCAVENSQPLSPSAAHQKLGRILKEDYGLSAVIKEFDHSLWLYLPFEESFFKLAAKPEPVSPASSTAQISTTVQFLDGKFINQTFLIGYDIGPVKSYPKDYGYTSMFTGKYQTDQRNILSALSRAYGEVDAAEGNSPKIFVIVMADIESGLEAYTYLHIDDLKRAFLDPSFYEEYTRRVVSEQPVGDAGAIGDTLGTHVKSHDVTLPEFLAKQIIYRINYKYTRSAFPPKGTPKEEVLASVNETLSAYGFEDFKRVELEDLASGMVEIVPREDIPSRAPASKPSEGRLIHLKFQ